MPKNKGTHLTDRFLRNLTEPGYYTDGRARYGFHCQAVTNADGDLIRYLRQNLTLKGERITVGLETYPEVSLQDARDTAHGNWKQAKDGIDPRKKRRKVKVCEVQDKDVFTFNKVGELVISERKKKWKETSSSETTWRGELRRHVYPAIGHLPIRQVTDQHLSDILIPLLKTHVPTAKSLLTKLSLIFVWCKDNKYLDESPVTDNVLRPVRNAEHQSKHYQHVPYDQVLEALQLIRGSSANMIFMNALEFQIYTVARHKSIRTAMWGEIDWKRQLWTIPEEHMKMGLEHRVPLNAGAMAVLKKMLKLRSSDSDLIFPSPRKGGVIGSGKLSAVCRDAGVPGTPHGFRGSFATWCAEKGVPQQIAEAGLAHRPSAIVRAYTHTDYVERRKPLMHAWSDHIAGKLSDDWRFREGDDAALHESYLESKRLLAEGQATMASMAATIESMSASMAEMAAELARLRAA